LSKLIAACVVCRPTPLGHSFIVIIIVVVVVVSVIADVVIILSQLVSIHSCTYSGI